MKVLLLPLAFVAANALACPAAGSADAMAPASASDGAVAAKEAKSAVVAATRAKAGMTKVSAKPAVEQRKSASL